MTRSQRAAQKLLDYIADGGVSWSGKPSHHVIDALRILLGEEAAEVALAKAADVDGSPDVAVCALRVPRG